MKKFAKAIAAVMAVAMIASCFAGCGKEKADSYFIGATGPLTGDASSYGISVNNGAKLAIEEINKDGGLNGVKFTYEMVDDKATAEDAATGYDTLFDKGMQIALGSVTSGSCESFASKAEADSLFFITPSASAASILENRTHAYRVCFGDPDQGILAAQELSANYKNIGCIYDSSDTYSTGIYEAFDKEMANLKASYKTQSFNSENKKDFSTQVEALKDCDVIFLPIYYTEAGLIAKAATNKGCSALLFGCDGLDGVADQIDGVTNKIKYITPFDVKSTDEKIAKFVKNYKEKYGTDPDQFAADGYDAVYAIFEAMKAAKINDSGISAADLSEKVIEAITASSFKLEGVTGSMTWDKTGACNKVPQIVELG